MAQEICRHVYVSGYVQGVGFRYSAVRKANNLGVCGWVRNLRDGRVELHIEGDEADVNEMVEWCSHGPRGATVSDVETETCSPSGHYLNFDVRF